MPPPLPPALPPPMWAGLRLLPSGWADPGWPWHGSSLPGQVAWPAARCVLPASVAAATAAQASVGLHGPTFTPVLHGGGPPPVLLSPWAGPLPAAPLLVAPMPIGASPCSLSGRRRGGSIALLAQRLACQQDGSCRQPTGRWRHQLAALPLGVAASTVGLIAAAGLTHFGPEHFARLAARLRQLSASRRQATIAQVAPAIAALRPQAGEHQRDVGGRSAAIMSVLSTALDVLAGARGVAEQQQCAQRWQQRLPAGCLPTWTLCRLLRLLGRWPARLVASFAQTVMPWLVEASDAPERLDAFCRQLPSSAWRCGQRLEWFAHPLLQAAMRPMAPLHRLAVATALGGRCEVFTGPQAVALMVDAEQVAPTPQQQVAWIRRVVALLPDGAEAALTAFARWAPHVGPPLPTKLGLAMVPLLLAPLDAQAQQVLTSWLAWLSKRAGGAASNPAAGLKIADCLSEMAQRPEAAVMAASIVLGSAPGAAARELLPTLQCMAHLSRLSAEPPASAAAFYRAAARWAAGSAAATADILRALVAGARRRRQAPAHQWLAFVAPFCGEILREDIVALLSDLARVPSPLWTEFAQMCAPLMSQGTPAPMLASMLAHCAAANHHLSELARRRDWQRALTTCRQFHDESLVSEENVMQRTRTVRCERAVRHLREQTGVMEQAQQRRWLEQILSDVGQLEALPAGDAGRGNLDSLRGHASQFAHCRRLLVGGPSPQDPAGRQRGRWPGLLGNEALLPRLSLSDGSKVGVQQLAAWVRMLIDRLRPASQPNCGRERQNLIYSLIWALAQSVEQHGEVVCAVGISQRLVSVLQGYLPGVMLDPCTPAELLCELGREWFFSPQADANDHQVAAFAAAARGRACQEFGANTPAASAFEQQLQLWLDSYSPAQL